MGLQHQELTNGLRQIRRKSFAFRKDDQTEQFFFKNREREMKEIELILKRFTLFFTPTIVVVWLLMFLAYL